MRTMDKNTFPPRQGDTTTGGPNWLVMKFGGTSVSSVESWETIRELVLERQAAGYRPVIVHSALATVSNRLDAILQTALSGEYQQHLDEIIAVHTDLAAGAGVDSAIVLDDFLQN